MVIDAPVTPTPPLPSSFTALSPSAWIVPELSIVTSIAWRAPIALLLSNDFIKPVFVIVEPVVSLILTVSLPVVELMVPWLVNVGLINSFKRTVLFPDEEIVPSLYIIASEASLSK